MMEVGERYGGSGSNASVDDGFAFESINYRYVVEV